MSLTEAANVLQTQKPLFGNQYFIEMRTFSS